jgi:hypothetical protein
MRFVFEETRDASMHVDVSRVLRAVTSLLLALSYRVAVGSPGDRTANIISRLLPDGAVELEIRAPGEPFPEDPFSPVHIYVPVGAESPSISLAPVKRELDAVGATISLSRDNSGRGETCIVIHFPPNGG